MNERITLTVQVTGIVNYLILKRIRKGGRKKVAVAFYKTKKYEIIVNYFFQFKFLSPLGNTPQTIITANDFSFPRFPVTDFVKSVVSLYFPLKFPIKTVSALPKYYNEQQPVTMHI